MMCKTYVACKKNDTILSILITCLAKSNTTIITKDIPHRRFSKSVKSFFSDQDRLTIKIDIVILSLIFTRNFTPFAAITRFIPEYSLTHA